jgi:hypothetical protein
MGFYCNRSMQGRAAILPACRLQPIGDGELFLAVKGVRHGQER